MLKKIALAATLALTATATLAADTGFYAGLDVGSTKFDFDSGRKTSFGGFAGYQFNENFALEGAYRRLGSVRTQDINQAAFSVLGMIPVGNNLKVFGRLGYNHIDVDRGGSVSGGMLGLGVSYAFTQNVSARFELQRPSADSTNFNVGVAFKF